MITFDQLSDDDKIQEVIKSAFDADIPIDGSWGYTKEASTIITTSDTPYAQTEHMFASMRAYIEMNMTQDETSRYGSINVNELCREEITIDTHMYHKVSYEITAMIESLYTIFIKEYKENYGKKDFNLTEHFKKRKEATLKREVTHWFKLG